MSAIIITGGAGFIGYNIALFYQQLGYKIIIVDDKTSGNHNAQFDYIPKKDFRELIANNHEFADIRAVFHQGACSDTMETDNIYMVDNNSLRSDEMMRD